MQKLASLFVIAVASCWTTAAVAQGCVNDPACGVKSAAPTTIAEDCSQGDCAKPLPAAALADCTDGSRAKLAQLPPPATTDAVWSAPKAAT